MNHGGFPKEVYNAWDTFSPDSSRWYTCLHCGQNHADSLHHNFGRGGPNRQHRRASNSILNSVPLNNELCHISQHSKVKNNKRLLKKVFEIVQKAVRRGEYRISSRDRDFYKIHEETYKEINCIL